MGAGRSIPAARCLHLTVPLWVPLASASSATFASASYATALNSILIRIQHQVVFIPAFRAAHLLAAMFAVGTVLATSAPAVAKHGEREVFEGGHDNGRDLGWYKHGGPAFADPAYPRYSGHWVGRASLGRRRLGLAEWRDRRERRLGCGLGPRSPRRPLCPAGRVRAVTGFRRPATGRGERALDGSAGALLRPHARLCRAGARRAACR